MRVVLVPGPSIAGDAAGIAARLAAGGAEVEVAEPEALTPALLAAAEVVAAPGSLRCNAAFFDQAPRLRGLVSIGTGQEGFDLAEAGRRAVLVRRGATREGVAGMAGATIMLMLALCHDLPSAMAAARRGGRRDPGRARALDGLTVGLVGYGAIGREVARRLRAWDVVVQVSTPSRPPGEAEDGARFVALDELLVTSDIVSLHAALTPASRNLLDRDRLARCRRGALIVNTARGGLLDEAALADALVAGAIGGAALDCFETEPLPADSPLRRAPNTILTPHQIGHTAEGAHSVIDALVANVLSFAPAPVGVQG